MNSRYITDDDGHRLRGTYFPFQMDKVVRSSSGFLVKKNPSKSSGHFSAGAQRHSPMAAAGTYMIVDYNQDQQHLNATARLRNSNGFSPGTKSKSEIDVFNGATSRKMDATTTRTTVPDNTLLLKSSFVLNQKVDHSSEELENAISQQLFNRQDAQCQTENELFRHDFPSLQEYNNWTNTEVEPFLKELRKCVKNQRPADLTAYIMAYCAALQRGDEPPVTVDSKPHR